MERQLIGCREKEKTKQAALCSADNQWGVPTSPYHMVQRIPRGLDEGKRGQDEQTNSTGRSEQTSARIKSSKGGQSRNAGQGEGKNLHQASNESWRHD